jgi:hypothetical protein
VVTHRPPGSGLGRVAAATSGAVAVLQTISWYWQRRRPLRVRGVPAAA